MLHQLSKWLHAVNEYSGSLQAIAAFVVAMLTAVLLWLNRQYLMITRRMVAVATSELDKSIQQTNATLEQTRIFREQWEHVRQPQMVIRVPPWRDTLTLEIVNVGEPTLVLHQIVLFVPVTTHSTSAINIYLNQTIVLSKSGFYEISLAKAVKDFLVTRQIPSDNFQSLLQVTVACKSWNKAIVVGMWALTEMRDGRICPPLGSVNLTAGRDLQEFQLYEQHPIKDLPFPVPMPLAPQIR